MSPLTGLKIHCDWRFYKDYAPDGARGPSGLMSLLGAQSQGRSFRTGTSLAILG